jgi:SAM-dependent methyltransferase
MSTNEPYRTDLAYIHDAGYGAHARAAAAWLLRTLCNYHIGPGRIIELGCGSGISSQVLAAAGFDVLGYDLSRALIAIARKRVPDAEFRVESYLTARLPPCVAVTAFGECFNYRFDKHHSPARLTLLFRRIFEALTPGGLFAFDVAGPGRVPGGFRTHHREENDWATLVTVEEDSERRLLTRRITTFRKAGKHFRRAREVHRLRLYPPAELAKQLRAVGFRVGLVQGYGKRHFPPGLVGFLARKPRKGGRVPAKKNRPGSNRPPA